MAKIIRCRDVGVECNFEARAATEEEILEKWPEHGKAMHGLDVIPPELVKIIREAIRDE